MVLLKKYHVYCTVETQTFVEWNTVYPADCPNDGSAIASENDDDNFIETMISFGNIKTITNSDSPFTVDGANLIINCDTSGGNITVNLPASASEARRSYHFRKTSASNTVTIDANGAELIDGSATATLTSNEQVLTITCDGTGWDSNVNIVSNQLDSITDPNDHPITGGASAAGINTIHSNLSNLGNDDHTQYALLAGRSGGQTIIGSTVAGEDLTLESTSNASKGTIKSLDPIEVNDIDARTATTLLLGKSTATKVEIADTGVVTEIQGNLDALEGIDVTGNITVSGTVDGRDITTDGSNLDNLYTTIGLSALTSGEVDQLENIGTTTISATQWGYLGATDQNVGTTDNVTFNQITGTLQTASQPNIDHSSLAGVADDDHTQYALLAGRSGGQSIIGGTAAGEDLTLESTSNASKGTIISLDPIEVNDIDARTATTLLLGKSTATKVEIADTGIVTEIQGNLDALEGVDVTGNITVSGTVDGRDIATDGSNLDNLYTTIGLSALTSGEVDQLENIGATTISATQWGYLGSTDQNVGTTDNVTFNQITGTIQTAAQSNITSLGILTILNVDNLRMDANTISSTNVNGNISILPNGTGEVLLNADPVSALGAVTKQYVDNNSQVVLSHSFMNSSYTYSELAGSDIYEVIGEILFPGSTDLGITPDVIKITQSQNAGGTNKSYRWRIQDVTNSLTICESGATQNVAETILDLGTVSNVPTASARWQVQILQVTDLNVPSSHNRNARLHALNIYKS